MYMYSRRRFRPNMNRQYASNRGKVRVEKYIFTPTEVVSGAPVEQIKNKFDDFGLDPRVMLAINRRGYGQPTPIQDQTIALAMAKKDVVGIANTGTGKTAAFLLPIIHKLINNQDGRVLILAPTRELAGQIQDELRLFATGLNIYSMLAIGGGNIGRQIYDLSRNPRIVIGTPGRVKDFIQRKNLRLDKFNTVVIDEVDRMVDIGFINDIKFILGQLPGERQSLFFSATISRQVSEIIQQFLKAPVTVSVKTRETSKNVHQDVVKVRSEKEKEERLQGLLRNEEFEKVIIFGKTKWGVERLTQNLVKSGFFAVSIHGNKSQSQRQRALGDFKQNKAHILVATDVAARGLDIQNVSHVINYDEPATYDDYVHRIGRTGRAESMGKALTFVMG